MAFEFIEVRTGLDGLKPILRREAKIPSGAADAFATELGEIITDMRGEVGGRKRANARKVQSELALVLAWGDDGSARKAFENMLEKYCKVY